MSDTRPAPDLRLVGRIMPASNATFLAESGGRRLVYKPIAGERPLWDFPSGTLAQREVAAYAVSEVLGWRIVPPTWLGDGPHGPGMLQEWQEPDPAQQAVDVVAQGQVPAGLLRVVDAFDADDRPVTLVHEDSAVLRRMAVFDVLVNNADRKGGHVLAMPGGHRYGVDHGVCFHEEGKLRTVLWGWSRKPLAEDERVGVGVVRAALGAELGRVLAGLLEPIEVEALGARCDRLLRTGVFPEPSGEWPSIPWPAF
ncbi:SCO1664 family protein [Nocardioides sp.]|uniref:SCO1664 family protein n=1 Tax=Nocardioides sp. TaxID=35761 RepID=UPI002735F7E9|nr:SCO1664 family protein [Nocardioides sp.]MDP3892872.1 SCO1664 family protein [Nocardioides sp.]